MYSVKKLLIWICLTYSVFKTLDGYMNESDSDTVRIRRESINGHTSRNGSCVFPEYLKNGMYFVYGSDETYSPGMQISDQEIIIVECNDGYRLYGVDHILCSNGTWSYPFGQCLIPSGNRNCTLPEHPKNGRWIVYRALITYYPGNKTNDGDVLYIECHDGYVLDGISIISCMDGTWSYPIGKCSKFELLSVSDRSTSCVLPEYPKNGTWSVYQSLKTYSPGNLLESKGILNVYCNTGYLLDGNNLTVCLNGTWSSPIGECLSNKKRCPSLNSTRALTVTCFYNNVRLSDCMHPADETEARFKCAPFYEDQLLGSRSVQTCKNGTWSWLKPKCVPVCGMKSKAAPTRFKRVINGTNVQIGDYPWQAAIYTEANKQLICGGTLISLRVILTAAHFITEEDGKPLPKENYIIAAGKYYRKYDDNRDQNDAQFSKLQEYFLPKAYKGSIKNYVGDIAVLITVKTFTVSSKIQPVCVDWGSTYDRSGEYGYVTGWGLTSENENLSETLKELRVPLISDENCKEDFPEDYRIYLTDDKFCAGYLNRGTALCKGDTGGGLVVKRNNGRYFLTGIASLGPASPSGGCDIHQYTLYTNVQRHKQFISRIEEQFPSLD